MSEKHKKQNRPALLGGALLLILLTLSNIDMLHDLFLELNLRNLDCWVYGGIFLLFSPVLTALASLLISWFCVYVPEEEREADHV